MIIMRYRDRIGSRASGRYLSLSGWKVSDRHLAGGWQGGIETKALSFFFIFLLSGLFFSFFLFIPRSFAADIVPNELGRIPIMEYHSFDENEDAFVRSFENFRRDLEFFYTNGFVLISFKDYINQNFNVPFGRMPLIFTFDDGVLSQFNILEDGSIDPDSAIGIMDAFFAAHPDFGRSAIFYLNQNPFRQKDFAAKKLRYLLDTDREIGNHTINHDNLRELDSVSIQTSLSDLQGKIDELLGSPYPLKSLAYPFGAVPREENLKYLKNGQSGAVTYSITHALLVGADPEYPSYHIQFDPYAIRRIQADDSEFKRWFGRDPSQIIETSYSFIPFVSDGDPKKVSILEKDRDKVKSEALKQDIAIVLSSSAPAPLPRLVSKGWDKALSKPVFQIESQEEVSVHSQEKTSLNSQTGSVISQADQLSQSEPTQVLQGRVSPFQPALPVSFESFFDFFQIKSEFEVLFTSFNDFLQYFHYLASHIRLQKIPNEIEFTSDGYFYTVQDGDTLGALASKFLPYTSYYLRQDFISELEKSFESSDFQAGFKLKIPGIETVIIDISPLSDDRKGIYWTGYTAGSLRSKDLLQDLVDVSGNMVIFDVKETAGEIFYDTKVPLANEISAVSLLLPDVQKLVRTFHKNGVYAVARMTVFKDVILAQSKPEFRIKNRATGKPFTEGEVIQWVDPSHIDVQNYNIALAQEVAQLGVDEIQFDYIRFPTLGDTKDALYFYEKDHPDWQKYDVITDFLARTRDALKPYGVKLGVDVYGIIAWNDGIDSKYTGQKIAQMAQYVDVVYPMIYPSHFGPGFGGHKNPADEPYFFIQESTKKFITLIDGKAKIIPWIQGFPYRVSNFGVYYVAAQIDALKDIDIHSFAVWSAANKYDQSLPAF